MLVCSMSSSIFHITDKNVDDDVLTLMIARDGTVTPDRETVQRILSKRKTTDINLVKMMEMDADEVNMVVDNLTFVSNETCYPRDMSERSRMLCCVRMDHDYTPYTSPSHVPAAFSDDVDDEIALNLNLLEDGSLDPQLANEPLTKITKIVKGKAQTIFVNSKEKQRMINAGILKERATEKVFKKPKPPLRNAQEQQQPQPQLPTPEEELSAVFADEATSTKSVEKETTEKVDKSADASIVERKPPLKKEKKVVKTLPSELALFSAPDILRRVDKPETEKLVQVKPAKVTGGSRSKSTYEERAKTASLEEKSNRRPSLDEVVSKPMNTPDKPLEAQVSVQEFSETLSNSNESIADAHLEPMPSAEDIRAMIHNENTKSFTINTVLPDTTQQLAASNESATTLSLDSTGLELDQTLLDINTDLSEDMLYQVAQSLVDNNADLQTVIDKSINEVNLPAIEASDSALASSLTNLNKSVDASSASLLKTDPRLSSAQVVRPDGRVVNIPPIERPATRSRNKRPSEVTPQETTSTDSKTPKNSTRKRQEENNRPEDEDDDDVEESDDDPNKLWCICNQPHNNRFMICCDTCEEWYHGKCVNVTKSMGQIMEDEGKEWMCVYCKDPNLRRPNAALRRLRKASKASSNDSNASPKTKSTSSKSVDAPSTTKVSAISKPSIPEKKNSSGCVVCGKASRSNSIYCSDTCILKHAQGVEKVHVYNRKTGRLLPDSNTPSAAKLDKWLQDNPSYEVMRSTNKMVTKVSKPQAMVQSKLKLLKNSGDAGVSLAISKKDVNIGVLPHSPKATKPPQPVILNAGVKTKISSSSGLKVVPKPASVSIEHGSQQENRTKSKITTPTNLPTKLSQPAEKPKVKVIQTKLVQSTRKDGIAMPMKTPKLRQAECSTPPKGDLRDTARKTFFEQLSNRLKNVDDLKLTDDELKQVSDEIESQLYKCFADTGQKYRNKYRSLIFNIKDPKNQTLWRRICEKAVNPYQLVRLSHDDLASQELALWREREAKHQLDMIKKSELELLNCKRKCVFKTHKGETVFEDEAGKDQVPDVIANVNESAAVDAADSKTRGEAGKSGKHSRRDRTRSRDRKSNKHRSRSKEDRKRRSRSREHSRRRSRDRHRDRRSSHKSSRHRKASDEGSVKKDKLINTEKLDKRSKEILEQLVDKQIVPPLEDGAWKQEESVQVAAKVADSDSDHEPSSTVTIPTPPHVSDPPEDLPLPSSMKVAPALEIIEPDANEKATNDSAAVRPSNVVPEQPLSQALLWKGTINMIDVANIAISAYEVSGDCVGLGDALPKTLDIVGRITPVTVWDYIGKMKLLNSKVISVLRLCASSMEERTAYLSLYNYLSSRQRLGVVKCVNKRVKDFYILPLSATTAIPDVIQPITGPGLEENRPSLLLGVIVRDRRKRMQDAAVAHHQSKRIRVEVLNKGTSTPPPQTPVNRSYTPPPSREIRKLPVPDITEENDEDMDEPYSPADSDPDSALEKPNNLAATSTHPTSFLDSCINSSSTFEPFTNKFESIPGLDVTPTLPSNSVELEKKMVELDQQIAAQKAEIDKVSKDLVSSGSTDLESSRLANIAIPSNIHQILESIKIITHKSESEYQPESTISTSCISTDLTIPLILPKKTSRVANAKGDERSNNSVLSKLSEEDLIKKAAEMEMDMVVPAARKHSNAAKHRLDYNQPPIPGIED